VLKNLKIQRRPAHAFIAGALDQFHGDPFDRMLIAQAICENMHLVSRDSKLKYYQAPVIW
jgi:PIN domain nuclease of toxin-antitoxin system